MFSEDFYKDFSEIYKTQNSRMYNLLCSILTMCKQGKIEEAKFKEKTESEIRVRENAEKIGILIVSFLILKSVSFFLNPNIV